MAVRTMNFFDISQITLNSNIDHQYIGSEKYNKLFVFGARYYIINETWIWFIRGDSWNADILSGCDSEQGIRPVVSLKTDVKTSSFDLNNFWNIEY